MVLLLHRPHRSELSQEEIKTKATNPISYTGLVRIPFQRLIMNYHPDNGNGRAFSYNSINHALCPLPAESASPLIQKKILPLPSFKRGFMKLSWTVIVFVLWSVVVYVSVVNMCVCRIS